MAPSSKPAGASVRLNEDADQYELGAEVDGHFVPFYTLPGTSVRATVEAAENAAAAAPTDAEQ